MLSPPLTSCSIFVTLFISVFSFSQIENNSFVFETNNSTVDLRIVQNIPVSKVTVWSVDMKSSTAMLNVDSYIPADERGFWIIGFKSRIHEMPDIITIFGDVLEADQEGNIVRYDEEGNKVTVNEYCSNLPYYAGHNVTAVLFAGNMYVEQDDGRYRSMFDWRLKTPNTLKLQDGGRDYYKISEKASRVPIKEFVRCGGAQAATDYTAVQHAGIITYTKALYHTYIRVKEECLSTFSFDVATCTEVLERTTLLMWTLSTQMTVSGNVESGVEIGAVASPLVIEAQVGGTGWYQLLNTTVEQEESLVGSNITLKVDFNSPEPQSELHFYLDNSFNITDSPELQQYLLVDTPTTNISSVLHYLNASHAPPLDTPFYQHTLAGVSFPQSELDPALLNTTRAPTFRFNLVYKAGEVPTEVDVYQNYGHVSCYSDKCAFSERVLRVRSRLHLANIVSNLVKQYSTEVKWSVAVLAVSGYNNRTQTVSPLRGSYRPLYATEKLLVSFTVSPAHVLRTNQLGLAFITSRRYKPHTSADETKLSTTDKTHLNTTTSENKTHLNTEDATHLNTSPATPGGAATTAPTALPGSAVPESGSAPVGAVSDTYLLYYDTSLPLQEIAALAAVRPDTALTPTFGTLECSDAGVCELELQSKLFSGQMSGYYNLTLGLRLAPRTARHRRAGDPHAKEKRVQTITADFSVYISSETAPYWTRDIYSISSSIAPAPPFLFSFFLLALFMYYIYFMYIFCVQISDIIGQYFNKFIEQYF